MNDEQDKSAEQEVEAEPKGPRGGERLAEARREQQISVLEVAKELHLDEPKVRALERNDFEMLGAPVFAKGHLKKYASLVGVDADDVLADYYKMTRQETMPPVVVGRRRARQELSPGPWIAVIIVIVVAAASYWWFAVYSNSPEATAPQSTPVEPQNSASARPLRAEPETEISLPEPEPVAVEPEAAPAMVATEVDDGSVRLTLSFSGECWTEVSDATGRRLFFDMGRSGQSFELSGVAPFAVLFGNVDNVSLQVDGNDYPVSSSSPGSRTARLTIMNP